MRFDLHINETREYKPRFFQVSALQIFSARRSPVRLDTVFQSSEVLSCFVLFFSEQHRSSTTVLFTTTSLVSNCSPQNNFFKHFIQLFFSEQLSRVVVWNYRVSCSFFSPRFKVGLFSFGISPIFLRNCCCTSRAFLRLFSNTNVFLFCSLDFALVQLCDRNCATLVLFVFNVSISRLLHISFIKSPFFSRHFRNSNSFWRFFSPPFLKQSRFWFCVAFFAPF